MNTPAPDSARPDDPPRTIRNFVGPASARASTCTPLPHTAADTPPPVQPLPEVGSEFLGFRLVRELGRGAFGRVFLATQDELAGRTVALKVSVDVSGESRSLAQLQHTNIVPVYSVHHDHGLHAVCMPYFGSTTLAHLLHRRRGHRPASGYELADTLRRLTARGDSPPPPPTGRSGTLLRSNLANLATPPNTAAVYDRLCGMTFTQAVCWMVARIADGLAHAHDRGIVHRDVKPANVLLTDDGQPMLLDFGVAADLKARAAVDATGGTVPYMAPEQLAGLFADTATADPRSDVYAVGVILYEWLTGTHPFSSPTGDLKADLPRLLDERRRWVPRLREVTADVPADLEAIVRTCVAADPARRYQSAADLSEDLRRQAAHEPLRVAAEPGGWSQLAKWRKRNPRLGGQLVVAGAVLVGLALCVGAVIAWRGVADAEAEQSRRVSATAREKEWIDAAVLLKSLRTEVRAGRYTLVGRVNELRSVPTDLSGMGEVLGKYGLPDDPDWRTRPAVEALPPEQRQELLFTLSDACLLMARARLQAEDGGTDAAQAAERWNALAEDVRPGPVPQAVYSQRANIFARLDRPADARAMREAAENTPLLTAEDHFLSGDDLLAAGRPADAAPFLRTAVRLDPTHFWAQFQLGVCYHLLRRPYDARACYSAAIALRPEFAFGYFNRAMAGVPLQAHADVIADLDAVLALEPGNAPAHLHRAHALALSNDRTRALADLDAVLANPDPGGMHVRAYLQRAKLKKLGGDPDGAAADTAAALPLTPTDEIGWLLRGLAQVDADPAAALADIRQAVKLNPYYVTALRNEVHVLEKLKRYDEAAAVMERVLPLAPRDMVLLASSGVLHARIGKADVAEKQTVTALAGDRSPGVRLSAATTYALLSAMKPELKPKAVKLLDELVKEGVSPAELKADPDFAALRDDPEFQKLVGGK